jgi:hypothetical protein
MERGEKKRNLLSDPTKFSFQKQSRAKGIRLNRNPTLFKTLFSRGKRKQAKEAIRGIKKSQAMFCMKTPFKKV